MNDYDVLNEKLDAVRDNVNRYQRITDTSIEILAKRGGGSGVNIVKCTLSEYRALAVKDPTTLYVITNIDLDYEATDI